MKTFFQMGQGFNSFYVWVGLALIVGILIEYLLSDLFLHQILLLFPQSVPLLYR